VFTDNNSTAAATGDPTSSVYGVTVKEELDRLNHELKTSFADEDVTMINNMSKPANFSMAQVPKEREEVHELVRKAELIIEARTKVEILQVAFNIVAQAHDSALSQQDAEDRIHGILTAVHPIEGSSPTMRALSETTIAAIHSECQNGGGGGSDIARDCEALLGYIDNDPAYTPLGDTSKTMNQTDAGKYTSLLVARLRHNFDYYYGSLQKETETTNLKPTLPWQFPLMRPALPIYNSWQPT
jgi:hypothetical protein